MNRSIRIALLALSPAARRGGLIATVQTWLVRSAQRRALRELPDAMLKDIGISRADAHGEAMKRFWES